MDLDDGAHTSDGDAPVSPSGTSGSSRVDALLAELGQAHAEEVMMLRSAIEELQALVNVKKPAGGPFSPKGNFLRKISKNQNQNQHSNRTSMTSATSMGFQSQVLPLGWSCGSDSSQAGSVYGSRKASVMSSRKMSMLSNDSGQSLGTLKESVGSKEHSQDQQDPNEEKEGEHNGAPVLHPCWTQRPRLARAKTGNTTAADIRRSRVAPVPDNFESIAVSHRRRCSCLDLLVANPNSRARVCYDVFGLLLIFYDLIWLPMQVFDTPKNGITEGMGWLTTCYWTADVVFSFFVGYSSRATGETEMRIEKIAVHYLKSMFAFDILVVAIDWVLTIMTLVSEANAGHGGVAYVRFAKAVRFLRLLRLLRLFKAHGVISELLKRIQSESWLILIDIMKLLFFIIVVNHLIACAWYGVAVVDDVRTDTWLKQYDMENKVFAYQYLTALHWSFCQFTPASMDVNAQNAIERLVSVLVIISAMVLFSSFVSTITNAMNQLRNLHSERNAQLSVLRSYFTENDVSSELVARINDCLSQAMRQSKARVHETDVVLLQLLPVSLTTSLFEEVHAPILGSHPLFHEFEPLASPESRKLYSTCVKSYSKSMSVELFIAGEAANCMYFVVSGTLAYNSEGGTLGNNLVESGGWLSEPAMWLHWRHSGTAATSSSHCELVALDVVKAQEALQGEDMVRNYARIFASYFTNHPNLLSDIWADMDEISNWAELVAGVADESAGRLSQTRASLFGNVMPKRESIANPRTSELLKLVPEALQAILDAAEDQQEGDESDSSSCSEEHGAKDDVLN